MIAKIIIPIKRGASNSMRNTIMATIKIRAIIPIIIAAIVPPNPKMVFVH
jgi:hypothetical protein